MSRSNQTNVAKNAEYTAKAIAHLTGAYSYFDHSSIMIDAIEVDSEVRMILSENGFHFTERKEEFELYEERGRYTEIEQ